MSLSDITESCHSHWALSVSHLDGSLPQAENAGFLVTMLVAARKYVLTTHTHVSQSSLSLSLSVGPQTAPCRCGEIQLACDNPPFRPRTQFQILQLESNKAISFEKVFKGNHLEVKKNIEQSH